MFRKYVEFFIQNLPNLLSVSFCGATIGFYPRITRILVVGFFLVLLGARHFLSYFKITISLCLNVPFSSIEKPSFKHRKDPFQASKGPLSSIERTPFKHRKDPFQASTAPSPAPRHFRRASSFNSVDGQAGLGQICSVPKAQAFGRLWRFGCLRAFRKFAPTIRLAIKPKFF